MSIVQEMREVYDWGEFKIIMSVLLRARYAIVLDDATKKIVCLWNPSDGWIHEKGVRTNVLFVMIVPEIDKDFMVSAMVVRLLHGTT